MRTNCGLYIYTALIVVLGSLSSCQWLPEVGKVSLNESAVTLTIGSTKTLTATVEPAAAEYDGITWSTSDRSVVSVSNGTIVAEKVGSATVTASAEGVTSAPCTVTVQAINVTGVYLNYSAIEITEGQSTSLNATVTPSDATDQSVQWSSGNTSVATVSGGSIKAVAPGKTTITVRTNDGGKTASCQVTVKAKVIPVTGVWIDQSTLSLTEGESGQLKATVSPSNATNKAVTYSSSNPAVAKASSDGVVTALAAGSTTITVKTADGGKTASCKVTVKSKVIDVTSITLSQSSISVKEEATLQLKVTVKPSNATNQEVTWSSGDKGIATVSSDGTVKGVTEGSTTITAKSANGKVTASCKVTVTAEYVYIPDANFRQYILDNFDRNRNGKLSLTEAAMIKRIVVNTDNINSLQGIEYMPTLSFLKCFGSHSSSFVPLGRLTKLDVSQNTALTSLYCNSNQLTSLDVSRNTALTDLYCPYNQLTSLDVSKNTALTYLNCSSNQLTSLDVSKNTALTDLSCSSNQLSNLDVKNNTALTSLYCSSNQLTSLDVKNNTALTSLVCDLNQLTSLDVSRNTALTSLYCYSNQLTSLDVSRNTALTSLDCYSNQLTSLDVSKNTALKTLWCQVNQLTSLDVSKNTALKTLWCQANQLTSLDVSKNTALTYLNCYSNQLTSLDVSRNTALTDLYCSSNKLTSLDVSKNKSITTLDCSPMSTLKTLYVSSGQNIEGVTVNRSTSNVPSSTSIVTR